MKTAVFQSPVCDIDPAKLNPRIFSSNIQYDTGLMEPIYLYGVPPPFLIKG